MPDAPTASPSAAPAASAPPATAADARKSEFRPVTGGEELQSGEKLLVEAYAAVWAIVFALVFVWIRRHRALSERVERLERALEAAERARGSGEAG